MGLNFSGRQDPKEMLLSYLRDLRQDLLLVLDNFEHILDGSGLVAELYKSSPHVRLLMTSRERILLPDVVHYELYGLPYPALGDLSEGFEQYGAVQLFQQAVHRTISSSRGETITNFSERDRGFVQRICAVVDGLPLGLELAAAWVSLFSYQEIAEQLERNLDLLITSRTDLPVRQRSARAVFDYFWDMLSESEQHGASSLSVFRGGFNGAAARRVAGVSPFFLSALADRTFLTRTLEGRYTLHELLRQYIASKLNERPVDNRTVHHQHANHYFEIARAAEPELNGPQQSEWLARLELDINNFRAAIDWYLDNGSTENALWLISYLRLFWYVRGHHFEALDRLLSTLGRADTTPPTLARAKALTTAGYLCIALNDYADGRALLEEALTIRRASGQEADVAETLSHLGMCAGLQDDHESAKRFLGEALIIWRSLDNYYEMGAVHHLLGEVCWLQDDYEDARQNFIESERFLRAIGDKIVFAIPVRRLGQLALRDGEPDRAYPAFIESLNHNHDLYDQRGMSACLAAFAGLAMFQGRVTDAIRLLSAVNAVLTSMGATLLPVDRLEYSRMIEKARAQLDEAAYNKAWTGGQSLSLDNAIEFVNQYQL
jgi:predicted ATPase